MGRPKLPPAKRICEPVTFTLTMDEFDSFNRKLGFNNRSAVLRSFVQSFIQADAPLALPAAPDGEAG